jgi:hypothetical protein
MAQLHTTRSTSASSPRMLPATSAESRVGVAGCRGRCRHGQGQPHGQDLGEENSTNAVHVTRSACAFARLWTCVPSPWQHPPTLPRARSLAPHSDPLLLLPSSLLSDFSLLPSSPYYLHDEMDFLLFHPLHFIGLSLPFQSSTRMTISCTTRLPPQLLSLPSGDNEGNLLPAISDNDFLLLPVESSSPLTPITKGMGLLLNEDEDDYGTNLCSPSPEVFDDIKLNLDKDVYPEFEQLCELCKKAFSAKCAVWHLEMQFLKRRDVAEPAAAWVCVQGWAGLGCG